MGAAKTPITACIAFCIATYSFAQQKPNKDSTQSFIDSVEKVEINAERGAYFNSKGIRVEEIITASEFKKAACCTLSESFELNNTVEISNADGVSGIKQIEMLGLAGKYVLMSRENIPSINGLATLNGLSNIPGPMVSEVHIAKGAGSVSLGSEALTGAINYNLKADVNDPEIFLNIYANHQARSEFNLIHKHLISKKALNHIYLHSGGQYRSSDMGGDGLADMPISQKFFIGDHLQIQGKKSEKQLGFMGYTDRKKGGTLVPGKLTELSTDPKAFQFDLNENHVEVYGKLGVFLSEDQNRSIGNIFQVSSHSLDGVLNSLKNRQYKGQEDRLFYSSLYQTPSKNGQYTKSGISYSGIHLTESLTDNMGLDWQMDGWQHNIGAFTEYTVEKPILSSVIGLRYEYNTTFGFYATPRVLLKWAISKTQRLNFQGGLARRTAYFVSENLPSLINGRRFSSNNIANNQWMPQEKAWNYGLSYKKDLSIAGYPATIVFDVFETQFLSQVVADRDESPTRVLIHSVSGDQAGRTRNAQIQISGYFSRRFTFKFGYRWIDSRLWLDNHFMQQALQSVHRGLLVLQYKTRNRWYFDGVCQTNSPKRLPFYSTFSHGGNYKGYSPWYTIVNLQIRKDFGKQFEAYIGGENLGNVIQHNPVVNWENPESNSFDGGYAWGPTNGFTLYLGIRLTVNK